jgi:hypothetical protein
MAHGFASALVILGLDSTRGKAFFQGGAYEDSGWLTLADPFDIFNKTVG